MASLALFRSPTTLLHEWPWATTQHSSPTVTTLFPTLQMLHWQDMGGVNLPSTTTMRSIPQGMLKTNRLIMTSKWHYQMVIFQPLRSPHPDIRSAFAESSAIAIKSAIMILDSIQKKFIQRLNRSDTVERSQYQGVFTNIPSIDVHVTPSPVLKHLSLLKRMTPLLISVLISQSFLTTRHLHCSLLVFMPRQHSHLRSTWALLSAWFCSCSMFYISVIATKLHVSTPRKGVPCVGQVGQCWRKWGKRSMRLWCY